MDVEGHLQVMLQFAGSHGQMQLLDAETKRIEQDQPQSSLCPCSLPCQGLRPHHRLAAYPQKPPHPRPQLWLGWELAEAGHGAADGGGAAAATAAAAAAAAAGEAAASEKLGMVLVVASESAGACAPLLQLLPHAGCAEGTMGLLQQPQLGRVGQVCRSGVAFGRMRRMRTSLGGL